MAKKSIIQRKPTSKPVISADLDAFLGGNATAKETSPQNSSQPSVQTKRGRPRGSVQKGNFRQSVPQTILDRLNQHLSRQENPPSRNAWIVQAILEKLENDT